MIEALVSAVLVAIMAVAFFGALNGSERVSGVGKLRAESAALAQDDQERMRSMPVTALNNLLQTNTRTVAGISFTVESRADWIADKVKAATCTSNGGAADYLKITSTVTPVVASSLKPVAITSTVTPAPGSFSGKGSLAIKVVDRNGIGVAAVPVNVTGPATAAAFTDATGCAFFGYLPAGTTYQVELNKGGYVDPNGDPTPAIGVTINDQQVATQGFTYDVPGAANVTFYTRPTNAAGTSLGVDVNSSQWKLVMFNGSTTPRTFGPGYPTSVPAAGISTPTTGISTGSVGTFSAPLLFPFTSAYGVYAGECGKNDPAQNGVTDPGLLVPPGDTTLTYRQRLPALNVYGTVAGTDDQQPPRQGHEHHRDLRRMELRPQDQRGGPARRPRSALRRLHRLRGQQPARRHGPARSSQRTTVAMTSLTDTLVTLPITTTSGHMLTRAARDESGQTLMELLIGMVISLVVLAAAYTVLAAATPLAAHTQDRVDAYQRGRLALDVMALRAAFAGLPAWRHRRHHPHDLDGQRDLVLREHGRRREAPQKRRVYLSGTALKEDLWKGTYNAAGPSTFPVAAPTTRTLVSPVVRWPTGRLSSATGASTPTCAAVNQPIAVPVSAVNAQKVVQVDISFVARPTKATAASPRDTDLPAVRVLPHGRPTDPAKGPKC